MNNKIYPSLNKKFKKKKNKEVKINVSEQYERIIGNREDVVYQKMAIYVLILAIRDVFYEGKNKYLCHSRQRAIKWFKYSGNEIPFGFKTVCDFFDISDDKMWLKIRRLKKVNPELALSMLKSAESATFDNPRSILEDKENV